MKPSFPGVLGFTRMQRLGILSLSCLIVLLQLLCFVPDFSRAPEPEPQDRQWLALQKEIDSLKRDAAAKKPEIYPFNPNFISDYKGYRLGMSVDEIDRLHAFRKKRLFVNSALEFQRVTRVSDSLLDAISPYFKFPEWTQKRHVTRNFDRHPTHSSLVKVDINLATKQQLMAVYGIGDALSDRIAKQRDALGGFVSMSQMQDIWGLSPQVVESLSRTFDVKQMPAVKKLNVNEASVKELASFPYFRYAVAKSIVTYRSMNGKIANSDDLVKIPNFPVDNVKIIALYLEY